MADKRQLKHFDLVDGESCEVWPFLTGNQIDADQRFIAEKVTAEGDPTREGIWANRAQLAHFVVRWTLSDEAGSPLPVTPENVARLHAIDMRRINEFVGEANRPRTGVELTHFLHTCLSGQWGEPEPSPTPSAESSNSEPETAETAS